MPSQMYFKLFMTRDRVLVCLKAHRSKCPLKDVAMCMLCVHIHVCR